MASGAWEPAYLKDMVAWRKNPNIPMYGRWNHAAQDEGGVDLTSPQGTPVYALADGPLIGAGTFGKVGGFSYNESSSFGVVAQRITVPGYGLNDIYYQHINIDKSIKFCNNPSGSCNSQSIRRGQLIGTTGGFGEVEIGFNANWGGVWGTSHPAAWVNDPRPMIAALMNLGTPAGVSSGPIVFQSLGTGLGNVANHIAPDVSVAAFLYGLDVALELQNPFTEGNLANGNPTADLGLGITVPDPLAYASALGMNILNDTTALIVRASFILIGLVILYALIVQVGQKVSQGAINQVLEPVGGVQGAAKIAGMFV